jgi:hypothetical protein
MKKVSVPISCLPHHVDRMVLSLSLCVSVCVCLSVCVGVVSLFLRVCVCWCVCVCVCVRVYVDNLLCVLVRCVLVCCVSAHCPLLLCVSVPEVLWSESKSRSNLKSNLFFFVYRGRSFCAQQLQVCGRRTNLASRCCSKASSLLIVATHYTTPHFTTHDLHHVNCRMKTSPPPPTPAGTHSLARSLTCLFT